MNTATSSKGRQLARRRNGRGQLGFAMVEAMVSIVIFSIGILGIVGMQARSSQLMSDAVFRAQAAQVASELIAEMWTSDPVMRPNLYSSAASGLRYNQWRARFQSGATGLPGSTTNPPSVVVVNNQVPLPTVPVTFYTVSDVTVTVFWQTPGGVVSQYVTTARILEPQS